MLYLQVNGAKTYCYTGGKPFDPAQPTVVFIHGVFNDHSVWILQSRYLAHHGWNVLALDLPGHCHSWGSLIALEAAVRLQQRVSHLVLGPGTWVHGTSTALNRRVLASNKNVNLFHRGFQACDAYANGDKAIAQMDCPVLFVLGALDQMTPPKAAQRLIARAREAGKTVQAASLPMGHHQMSEAPDKTLFAIRDFLRPG